MFDLSAWGLKIFRASSLIDLYEWNSSQFAKISDANALNPFDLKSIRNSKQFIKENPFIYMQARIFTSVFELLPPCVLLL